MHRPNSYFADGTNLYFQNASEHKISRFKKWQSNENMHKSFKTNLLKEMCITIKTSITIKTCNHHYNLKCDQAIEHALPLHQRRKQDSASVS